MMNENLKFLINFKFFCDCFPIDGIVWICHIRLAFPMKKKHIEILKKRIRSEHPFETSTLNSNFIFEKKNC